MAADAGTVRTRFFDLRKDPKQLFLETDPVGDSRQPYSPTYAISKIAQLSCSTEPRKAYRLRSSAAPSFVSTSYRAACPVSVLR